MNPQSSARLVIFRCSRVLQTVPSHWAPKPIENFAPVQPNRATAFSLVEILAAISVLLVVGLLAIQLISSVSLGTGQMSRKMESFGNARFALDRLALDLRGRNQMPSAAVHFRSVAGNDILTFWTLAPGATNDRELVAVQYRVKNHRLERATVAQPFVMPPSSPGAIDEASLMPFHKLPSQLALGSGSDSSANYEPLADAVFRMEFCFLMKDGTLRNDSMNWDHPAVEGLLITVAALDTTNQSRLSDAQITDMARSLPDFEDNGPAPATAWIPLVESGLGSHAVKNSEPGRAVRVVQRFYPRTASLINY